MRREKGTLWFLGGLEIHLMTSPQCALTSAWNPLEPEQNSTFLQTHKHTLMQNRVCTLKQTHH